MLSRFVLFNIAIAVNSVRRTAGRHTAQCTQCGVNQGCSICQNCRPNHVKIVYRRNAFGSGFVGAAPPQGFAVSSVPAIMVSTPAFAATPAFAVAPTSFATTSFGATSFATTPVSPFGTTSSAFGTSNLSQADLARLVQAVKNQNANANAFGTGSDTGCPEACNDIRQLQQDVKVLRDTTDKLTTIVGEIRDTMKELKK